MDSVQSGAKRESNRARFVVVAILFMAAVTALSMKGSWVHPRAWQGGIVAPAVRALHSAQAGSVAVERYGALPLRFEPNRGQFDSRVKFVARGERSSLFLTEGEAVLAVDAPLSARETRERAGTRSAEPREKPREFALRMSVDGERAVVVRGAGETGATSNYFVGNDASRWMRRIPNFARVQYVGVYPGVDLVFYGHGDGGGRRGLLEYDFNVAPGADAGRIRLKFAGQNRLQVARDGHVILRTAIGDLLLKRPEIYQIRPDSGHAEKVNVAGQYFLAASDEIGFRIGAYDKRLALVIDPVLVYSTFLGGTTSDQVNAVAVDATGEAYVTGKTSSSDFPVTSGPAQGGLRGPANAFVAKLNAAGTQLIYSTYLGGSNSTSVTGDSGQAIAVDSDGNAYVAGLATSSDFPTVDAIQTSLRSTAGNGFVAEIDSNGAGLLYSTYLGGSGATGDQANGIAVDSTGAAYVAGTTSSTDFPLQGAFETTRKSAVSDAFVSKVAAGGGSLIYSTYLGGSGAQGDMGNAIALGPKDDVFVAGATSSSDFPVTSGAFQAALAGSNFNAFLARVNPSGASLAYATYLGGAPGATQAFGVAADSTAAAYLTGSTLANDFPVTGGAFQTALGGSAGNAFVSKIVPGGKAAADLIYSTYLGGSTATAPGDVGRAIAVDTQHDAVVTGLATSANFPVTPGAFQTALLSAAGNAFVTRLGAAGRTLLYSTYLGGSGAVGDEGLGVAVDSSGSAYVGGRTSSANFPVTQGAPRPQFLAASGDSNGFVSKLSVSGLVEISPMTITFGNQYLNIAATAQIVTVTNNSATALTFTAPPKLSGANAKEFSIASQCGTTLVPGASCTVEVGFTPTSFGNFTATLTFNDTSATSPQTVTITGTGYQDFTLAGPTTETVGTGTTLTFSVTVTPLDNSHQTIKLTCTGAPADSTCTISPATFQLDGTDVVTANVNVTTQGLVPPANRNGQRKPWGNWPGALAPAVIAAIGAALGIGMLKRKPRRAGLALGFVAVVFAVCVIVAGCGGGNSTPEGINTLVITATATPGGQSHVLDVALTVD